MKRERSEDSSDGDSFKRKRELIQIWVKVGEDGQPEEVTVDPNISISKV